jgi:hypothetical protein
MISFQQISSGKFLSGFVPGVSGLDGVSLVSRLADAMPYHPSDETRLRRDYPVLAGFRLVTFSSRIDHPDNQNF